MHLKIQSPFVSRMKWFIIFILLWMTVVRAFEYHEFKNDYKEFKKNQCFEGKNIPTINNYFPYETYYPKKVDGFICENFKLDKENLEFMARNDYTISDSRFVFLRNCKIDHFNEFIVSKFPNVNRLYFENCEINMKDSGILSNVKVPSGLSFLSFQHCLMTNTNNSRALQKFNDLEAIFVQNSRFQQYFIDEHFFPQRNNIYKLYFDSADIKKFYKGSLSKLKNPLTRFACTSCNLEELDSIFSEMNLGVREILLDGNFISKFPKSLDKYTSLSELSVLSLPGNKITEVMLKRSLFKPLENLKTLDLSRNTNITSIGFLAFQDTSLKRLNMSNVNMKYLDKLGKTSLESIDFSYNLISNMPNNTFEELVNLKLLNLSHNRLYKLDDRIFSSLINLQELRLSHNFLTMISPNTFMKTSNLKLLDLSYNFVTNIDSFLINGLHSIRELNLIQNCLTESQSNRLYLKFEEKRKISMRTASICSIAKLNISQSIAGNDFSVSSTVLENSLLKDSDMYNKSNQRLEYLERFDDADTPFLDYSHNLIKDIPEDTFGNLTNLKALNLSNNLISKLKSDIFENLSNLEVLVLKSNKIESISNNTFNGLYNLKQLDLSCNRLSNINGLYISNSLEELHIQKYLLPLIYHNSIFPKSLKVLNISDNPLRFIGKFSFGNLDQLVYLDLSNINGSFIYFDQQCFKPLKVLRRLKLRNANIDSIEKMYFPLMLEKLDLSFNKITSMANRNFTELKGLQFLDLSFNKIEYIQKDQLRKMLEIKFIDFSGNKIYIMN